MNRFKIGDKVKLEEDYKYYPWFDDVSDGIFEVTHAFNDKIKLKGKDGEWNEVYFELAEESEEK